MYRGFIKLYRAIDDWEWRAKPNTLSVWLYLLTHARHEAGSWQGIPLEAGQLITSVESIGKVTGLDRQPVRTALEHLKKTGEITVKATNKFSIVTVVKWGLYQSFGMDTNQQTNQRATNNQPATNQQLTTNKNEKNEIVKELPPPTPSKGETPDGGGGGAGNYVNSYISGVNISELKHFLDIFPDDVVRHAVDEACANGKAIWSYVRAILNRYELQNVLTLDEARATDGKSNLVKSAARLGPWIKSEKASKKETYTYVINGEEKTFERDAYV